MVVINVVDFLTKINIIVRDYKMYSEKYSQKSLCCYVFTTIVTIP